MTDKFPWYTGAGDDGSTGLLGEGRVRKHHPQPEAFGDVDEASSAIGFARALIGDADVCDALLQTQRDLYAMMAELAATPEAQAQFRVIDKEKVKQVAALTDRFGALVNMPREFVCPGDSKAGAVLDVARAVVRRAERRVARLLDDGLIENPQALAYLNRLSSFLYVLARVTDARAGTSSVTLAKDTKPRR